MKTISLNGKWKCKLDIENLGIEKEQYNPKNYNIRNNNLINIEIPKSYNLLQGFEIFEGIFQHFYRFDLTESRDANNYDYQIRFKASNYNIKIWLNGNFIGEHDGGFTPFYSKLNSSIKEIDNLLVLRVDNILFPFCYFILTHLLTLLVDVLKKREFKKGMKLV